jgi:hypothetical protein
MVVKPKAASAGPLDQDQMFAFGLQRADELIDIVLVGAGGAKEDDLDIAFFRGIHYSDELFVDIQTDTRCGRMRNG